MCDALPTRLAWRSSSWPRTPSDCWLPPSANTIKSSIRSYVQLDIVRHSVLSTNCHCIGARS